MKKIYLIDSMAYIFRSYYGIRTMSSKDGRPTNALLGFIKSIEKLIRDFEPEYIAAVFDAGKKTFRNDIYPEYKANRIDCPEDLKPQFDFVKEYLKCRGIPLLIQPGFEADDIIGTVSKMATEKGLKTVICSGDKDMMQLIDDNVVMCKTHKDNEMVDAEAVVEQIGVRPDQVIDFLAIMGDSSDNVPGLPGIGKVGAAKLLNQYETLEGIFEHKDEVTGKKVIEAVNNHRDLADLSKELVTIVTDMTIEEQIEDMIPQEFDIDVLEKFYEEFSITTMAKSIKELRDKANFNNPDIPKSASLDDIIEEKIDVKITMESLAPFPYKNEILKITAESANGESHILVDKDSEDIMLALKRFKGKFKGMGTTFHGSFRNYDQEKIGRGSKLKELDFELLIAFYLLNPGGFIDFIDDKLPELSLEAFSHFNEMRFNEILEISQKLYNEKLVKYHLVNCEKDFDHFLAEIANAKEICVDTETTGLKAFEVDIVGVGFCFKAKEAWYIPLNGALPVQSTLAKLKTLLEDDTKSYFGQNIKYDYEIFLNNGIQIKNISFDTLVASYLCNPSRNSHGLDALALHYLNYKKIPTAQLIGKGAKQISMAEVFVDMVSTYCCEDVDITFRLKPLLAKELETRQQVKLFHEMDLPLIEVLGEMEQEGILLNPQMLQEMSVEFETRIIEAEKKIYQLAGHEFNIGSPKQLGVVLFDEMELNSSKKTKTGYSTDASVLETLAENHEIAKIILEYRGLTKLKSTYLDALPLEIHPEDKRIHASFSQTTAATGRLASSNPNLQNIPTRTEDGKKIRKAFYPKDGCVFLACDYSQVELRVMAHLSEDENLMEAFNNDFDVHQYTASLIYDIPMEEVQKSQRYNAKAVNFGIIYGQQAFGLAREINTDVGTAKKFIAQYFQRYPGIQKFMQQTVESTKETGFAETSFGRRRYIPEIHHQNKNQASFGERIAINSPIQGTAADIIKLAMIALSAKIKKDNLQSRMILQIHDELIFEVPENELEIMKKLVPEMMTTVVDLKVPLKVDVAVGNDWSECD